MITIQLKQIKVPNQKARQYYLTSITEEEKEKIIEHKKRGKLKTLIMHDIICSNIEKMGETSKVNIYNITPFIDSFPGSTYDIAREPRKVHYRDYAFSEERQKKSAAHVTLCEDATSSARSAIKQMRDKYTILWYKEV